MLFFQKNLTVKLQITSSVIALLDKYKWKKFSIIYNEDVSWKNMADHLKVQVCIVSTHEISPYIYGLTLFQSIHII